MQNYSPVYLNLQIGRNMLVTITKSDQKTLLDFK